MQLATQNAVETPVRITLHMHTHTHTYIHMNAKNQTFSVASVFSIRASDPTQPKEGGREKTQNNYNNVYEVQSCSFLSLVCQ